ncbi:butyrophilin subfamily 2 member A1-like [Notolabrus celidotus]|uniref:butyrophilin subfamily 2 member A1-like n=1 Tax=Notolabrus celidotus TaxID=1203425 RepID=UPI001490708F|nr:butyrophilin subfamily 2 member A1-like [Notolabrus celidotus]XP_034531915.1 butyrophilin subfamily 2 member A1-like [Notolabrus celidotus]XP_034531916.1 butyrophilin subfamily 2 member A1-like [Notolabrus celidotus]
MVRLKDGYPATLQQGAFRVFHGTVVFLFLTQTCAGQSLVVTPSQPVVAILGEDVILPCHLEPAEDATGMTVEWRRPDLNPRFVYVWRDGVELDTKKHPSFAGRTSVSTSKLRHGDVSLKLQRVQLSDEGKYGCYNPTPNKEATVQLVVGAVSCLAISLTQEDNDGVVLQCESKGWYPEPEVLWLDDKAKPVSAGPTETFRGPDGLYTVSSRVTVERRQSYNFTCRVHQRNTSQTRETYFHIPDDFFSAQCSSTTPIILSCVVALTSIFAVVLAVCFCKQKKKYDSLQLKKNRKTTVSYNKEQQSLMEEETETPQDSEKNKKIKELDEIKVEIDGKLKEMLRKRGDVVEKVSLFMNYKKDVEDEIKRFKVELQDVQSQINNKQGWLRGVKQTVDTAVTNQMDFMNQVDPKTKLETVKTELQEREVVLKWILHEVDKLTLKNTDWNCQIEIINEQLEEIKKQRNEMNTEPTSDNSETYILEETP